MILHSVTPDPVGSGQVVKVIFTVDEAVASEPVVSLGGLPMSLESVDALKFTFALTTSGTEPEGEQTLQIDVDYQTLGHETFSQESATTFDFSAPNLSFGAVSPLEAGIGAMVTAEVTVTEPYSDVASVTATLGGAAMTLESQEGSLYRFSYLVQGTEAEGAQDLQATAADSAGNSESQVRSEATLFDFSGPVVAPGTPDPEHAKAGDTIKVVVEVTDAHGSVAEVSATLGGRAMELTNQSGSTFEFSYVVQGTEPEGDQAVQVIARDEAGNTTLGNGDTPAVFDFQPPVVIIGSPVPENVRSGVKLVVPVTIHDIVSGVDAGTVTVTAGGVAMSVRSHSGTQWEFERDADGSEPEARVGVQVTAADNAGNPVVETVPDWVRFDFTSPTLAVPEVSPGVARQGTEVSASVAVTDTGGSGVGAVTAFLGGQAMSPGETTGDTRTFSLTVGTESGEGEKDLEVRARDLAGNERSRVEMGAVLFDLTGPVIDLPVMSDAVAKAGTHLVVTVVVTDVLSGLAEVRATLGGVNMALIGHSDDTYTFNLQVLSGFGEGWKELVVTAQDVAGNQTVRSLSNAVLYDFTPPVLTLESLEPAEAAAGTWVTARIRVGDTWSGVDPATVAATLDGRDMTPGDPEGDVIPFLYQVLGTEGEGPKALVAEASDRAGNTGSLSPSGEVSFDFTVPTGGIRVAWNDEMAPTTIPGPEPLNRFDPSLELRIGVRIQGGPLDLAGSRLRVERSDAGFGLPPVQTDFDEAFTGAVVTQGADVYAGQVVDGVVSKKLFTTPGFYGVTATLRDQAGNTAQVTGRFRTKFPQFTLRQGMPGASWNSPDLLMRHSDDLQAHYAPDSYPLDQGSEVWQFESSNDNFIGLRIRNQGNMPGDCLYRIFCVPGAIFTHLDTWKLITTGAPAGRETAITPPGTPGGDPDGYRITAGTNYNAAHPEWPDWTPPPEAPEQSLHTCVCAVIHGPEDPLVLRNAEGQSVVVTDDQMDTEGSLSPPSGFRGEVMAALTSYEAESGGYWNAVFGNEKIANVNFSILVTAAKAKSLGAAGGGQAEPAKGLDELPIPKPPFPPQDLPPEALPRPVPAGFRYTPWLYDRIAGWTEAAEREHPRPPLADPAFALGRLMLRTRGLRGRQRNLVKVDRRHFPESARVFLRLPLGVLSKAQRVQLRRLAPNQSLWKGTRLADPKIFGRIFSEGQPPLDRWVPIEIVSGRALLDGLELTERGVWIDVAYGVLTKGLRPKTGYVLVLEQEIDGRPVGNFDFHLRAYHPFDVPLVGDRRSQVAYRRSNPVVRDIPARALVFFDSKSSARASGYRLDPREFGDRPGLRLPAGIFERVLEATSRRVPLAGRLAAWLREAGAPTLPEESLEYLGRLPGVLAEEGSGEPDGEILELLARRP